MIINDIEVLFGGQAGDGSLTTGDLIATVFKRMGLELYTFKDFPSRIRGGHTNYVIRAGEHLFARQGIHQTRVRELHELAGQRNTSALHYHFGDRDEFLPTAHGFDEFFGNLYHMNAEEEPELDDYPTEEDLPGFREKFGPRASSTPGRTRTAHSGSRTPVH